MRDKTHAPASDRDVQEAIRPTSSRQAVLAEPTAYSPSIRHLYSVICDQDDLDDFNAIALPFYRRVGDRIIGPFPAWERSDELASIYIRATDIPSGLMETRGAAFVSYDSYLQAFENWRHRLVKLGEAERQPSAWAALKNFRYWGVTSTLDQPPANAANRLFASQRHTGQVESGSIRNSWLHWFLFAGQLSQFTEGIWAAQHGMKWSKKNAGLIDSDFKDEDFAYFDNEEELRAFHGMSGFFGPSGDFSSAGADARTCAVRDDDEINSSEPMHKEQTGADRTPADGDIAVGFDEVTEEEGLYVEELLAEAAEAESHPPISSPASRSGGEPPLWFLIGAVSMAIGLPIVAFGSVLRWWWADNKNEETGTAGDVDHMNGDPKKSDALNTPVAQESTMTTIDDGQGSTQIVLAESIQRDDFSNGSHSRGEDFKAYRLLYSESPRRERHSPRITGKTVVLFKKTPAPFSTIYVDARNNAVYPAYGPEIARPLSARLVSRRGPALQGDWVEKVDVFTPEGMIQDFRFTKPNEAHKFVDRLVAVEKNKEVTVLNPDQSFACDGDLRIIMGTALPAKVAAPTITMRNPDGQVKLVIREHCPEIVVGSNSSISAISLLSASDGRPLLNIVQSGATAPQNMRAIFDAVRRNFPATVEGNPASMPLKRTAILQYDAKYDGNQSVTIKADSAGSYWSTISVVDGGPVFNRVFTLDRGFLYGVKNVSDAVFNTGVISFSGRYASRLAGDFDRLIHRTDPDSLKDQEYECPISGHYRFFGNTTLKINALSAAPSNQTVAVVTLHDKDARLLLNFSPDFQGYVAPMLRDGAHGIQLMQVVQGHGLPRLEVFGGVDALAHIQFQMHEQTLRNTVRNPVGKIPVEGETNFFFESDVDVHSTCTIILNNMPGVRISLSLSPDVLLRKGNAPNTYRYADSLNTALDNIILDTSDANLIALFEEQVRLSKRTVVVREGEIRTKRNHRYAFGQAAYAYLVGGKKIALHQSGVETEEIEYSFSKELFHLSRHEASSNATTVVFHDALLENAGAVILSSNNSRALNEQAKRFEDSAGYELRMPLRYRKISSSIRVTFPRPWTAEESTLLDIAAGADITLQFGPDVFLFSPTVTENSIVYRSFDRKDHLTFKTRDENAQTSLKKQMSQLMHCAEMALTTFFNITDDAYTVDLSGEFPSQAILRIVDQRLASSKIRPVFIYPSSDNRTERILVISPLENIEERPGMTQFGVNVRGQNLLIRGAELVVRDLYFSHVMAPDSLNSNSSRSRLSRFEMNDQFDAEGGPSLFKTYIGAQYDLGRNSSERSELLHIRAEEGSQFTFHPNLDKNIALYLSDNFINYCLKAGIGKCLDFTQLNAVHPFAFRQAVLTAETKMDYSDAQNLYFLERGETFETYRFLNKGRAVDIFLVGKRELLARLVLQITAEQKAHHAEIFDVFEGDAGDLDAKIKCVHLLSEMLNGLFPRTIRIMEKLEAEKVMRLSANNTVTYALEYNCTHLHHLARLGQLQRALEAGDESPFNTSEVTEEISAIIAYLTTAFDLQHAVLDQPLTDPDSWIEQAQRLKEKDEWWTTASDLGSSLMKEMSESDSLRDIYVRRFERLAVAMIDQVGAFQHSFFGRSENYSPNRLGLGALFICLAAHLEGRSCPVAMEAYAELIPEYNHDLHKVIIDLGSNQMAFFSEIHEAIQGSINPELTKGFKSAEQILEHLSHLPESLARKLAACDMSARDAELFLKELMVADGKEIPRPEREGKWSYARRMLRKRFNVLIDAGVPYGGLTLAEIKGGKLSRFSFTDRMKAIHQKKRGLSVKTAAVVSRFMGDRDNSDWVQWTGDFGTVFVWPGAGHNYFKGAGGKGAIAIECGFLDKADKIGRRFLVVSGTAKTYRALEKWGRDPLDGQKIFESLGEVANTAADGTKIWPLKIAGFALKYTGDLFNLPSEEEPPEDIPEDLRLDSLQDRFLRRYGAHEINGAYFINADVFLRRLEEKRRGM